MELKKITGKLQSVIAKYRYAVIILIIGVVLLLLPGKSEVMQKDSISAPQQTENISVESKELADLLQSIDGAGKVQVMLSIASGERTQYITNTDSSESTTRTETVIITDSERNESGLIEQMNPPIYRGAVVVCQGADSATVRLAITQAVAKITGLSTDNICVLKMK